MGPSRTAAIGLLVVAAHLVVPPPAAQAQECGHAVVFTLPGVTWSDVRAAGPPELLDAVDDGAIASMAVRTNSPLTTYADGYATLGAGTRTDGARISGGPAFGEPVEQSGTPLRVAGLDLMKEMAEDAGYNAVPGALASGLGEHPLIAVGNGDVGTNVPVPSGFERWTLVAAMDREGVVEEAATGHDLILEDPVAPFGVRTDSIAMAEALDDALGRDCSAIIVEQGDLVRADLLSAIQGEPADDHRAGALMAADELLGRVRSALDPTRDLLLIVTPTSPLGDEHTHLGVAVAVGPGFEPGAELESASTGRKSFVTLPDVAPTVLAHYGLERESSMLGRAFVGRAASRGDRIASAIALDQEAVFVHARQGDIAAGFVVFQVLLYGATLVVLWRRRFSELRGRALRLGVLAIVAFPVSTFVISPLRVDDLGTGGFIAALLCADLLLVVVVGLIWSQPLDRLLALTAFTFTVLVVDLLLGGALHLNAVFGVDPIVAGRFSGLGNIAFAILGASCILTGALLAERWRDPGRALVLAGALFALAVLVDGAPQLGSDVGGVIALVPSLGVTWLLLGGRRPNARIVVVSAAAVAVALGAFLAIDLARPPLERTHLGRFFEDIRERGPDVFLDTIRRKARANIRVFRSTIWTYLVPPALALISFLLLRPRGRWQTMAATYPRLRAGLIGGLLLGVLGFVVNDSGVVVPAMILSFLVPMAVLMHLSLEKEPAA